MAGDSKKLKDNFNDMPIEELENIIENYYTDKSDEYEMEAIRTAEFLLKQRRGEKGGIKIEDIQMPFGSMVIFMVKWAIASIPAFIILFLIGMMVMGVFGVGIATLFK